jgi:hypothetical protein
LEVFQLVVGVLLMPTNKKMQERVIQVVRKSEHPPTPEQVEEKIGRDGEVRDAIVSLVDRGKLQVALDWTLRVKSS